MDAIRKLLLDHWKVAATFLGIFVAWEAAVVLTGVKPYVVPKPTAVLAQMATKMPIILDGTLATLQPMLAGYVLAVGVGVFLALLVAFWQGFRDTLYPVIVFLQIVPKIAIAPRHVPGNGEAFQHLDSRVEQQAHQADHQNGGEGHRRVQVVGVAHEKIAQTPVRGDELGDQGAGRRERGGDLEAGEERGQSMRKLDTPEDPQWARSGGAREIEDLRVD
jgi:hypothetical protein